MRTAVILYVPVLHRGYLEMIERYNLQAERLFLLDRTMIEKYKTSGYFEIRMVDPENMRTVIDALGVAPGGSCSLLDVVAFRRLKELGSELTVIMPQLDICRRLAEDLPEARVIWDSVFLQWDADSVMSQQVVRPDQVISMSDFDRRMMRCAHKRAVSSNCWWRHVGAVLVRDGEILREESNRHVPEEQGHYSIGDPRDFVPAGTSTEIATTLHAEQAIITWAAREGVSLKGCHLYTAVFPCPMCAKQIAYSGIERIFFESGHASLDGESILKSQGVELVLVQ